MGGVIQPAEDDWLSAGHLEDDWLSAGHLVYIYKILHILFIEHLRPAEQHCAIYVLQSSTVPSTSCRAALCHLSSSMSLKRQLKYQMMLTHVIAADCIVRRRFASNCAMSRLVFCTATTCRSTTLSTQSTNHHQ